MVISTISSGMALVFGLLHALEPGHGKTALLTYIVSGKKSWKDGVVISALSAITHSLVIFIIAFISHYLVHHGYMQLKMVYAGHLLNSVSGALICGLGIWILLKNNKAKLHKPCKSCNLHNTIEPKNKKWYTVLTVGILGIATGIIPCPSIIVAYLSGISSGNFLIGMQNVIFFGLGMFISLTSIILFFRLSSERIFHKFNSHSNHLRLNWRLIQGIAFITIGLVTAFYH